jgi:hypothetical protein
MIVKNENNGNSVWFFVFWFSSATMMSTSSVIPPNANPSRNPFQSSTLRNVLATTAIVFLTAIVLSSGDFSFVGRVTSFIESRWQEGLTSYGIHFFSVRIHSNVPSFFCLLTLTNRPSDSRFDSAYVTILFFWLSDDCDLLLSMAGLSLSVQSSGHQRAASVA